MIQLEHINLVVSNLDNSLVFYRAAFPQWTVRGGGKNDWHGKASNWLHFGDDYNYLALADNGVDQNRDLAGHQVGLAHFAFVTSDIKGVIKRLAAAGFATAKDGQEDEYRENVYFLDPDDYEVEFVQYFTDVPSLRNRY